MTCSISFLQGGHIGYVEYNIDPSSIDISWTLAVLAMAQLVWMSGACWHWRTTRL